MWILEISCAQRVIYSNCAGQWIESSYAFEEILALLDEEDLIFTSFFAAFFGVELAFLGVLNESYN